MAALTEDIIREMTWAAHDAPSVDSAVVREWARRLAAGESRHEQLKAAIRQQRQPE